jgi:hypothetical protein
MVEHEQPYQAVIQTAQICGCDAIHVALRGRRGISAIMLGSETLKELTRSAIPVIVCRRPHPATLGDSAYAAKLTSQRGRKTALLTDTVEKGTG